MVPDIRTQEFELGDIAREGWRLCRANFTDILLVSLIVYVPLAVAEMVLASYFSSTFPLSVLRVDALAIIAMAYIVERAVRNERTSWRTALRFALSRWVSLILTNWLAGLILLGLFLLLIIPGFVWSVYYVFFVYVVALRNISGKRALDYSKTLVRGQWDRIFGFTLVIGIPYVLVFIANAFLYNWQYSRVITTSQALALSAALVSLSQIVFVPFSVMLVVLFLNTDYLRNPGLGKVAWYNRGLASFKMGAFDQAIMEYTRAINIDAGYAHALFQRAHAHVRKESYDLALADYSRAIALDPGYTAALYRRGNIYVQTGDAAHAIEDYSRVIAIDPQYTTAYNNRGIAFKSQAKLEEAIADYTKAIELDPAFTDAYYNRGLARAEAGQPEQAIADYSRSIELDPGRADAHLKRGLALAQSGQRVEAIADLQAGLRLAPANPDRNELERTLRELQAADQSRGAS